MSMLSFKIRITLDEDDSYFKIIKDLAYLKLLADSTDENQSLKEERLNRELKIVQKYGFAKNFYLAYLIADYAKKQGLFYILLGNTMCSFLAYLLGISSIHPLDPFSIEERPLKTIKENQTIPLEVCFHYEENRVPIFHFLGSKSFYQAMLECETIFKEKYLLDQEKTISNCIIVTMNPALTKYQAICQKKKMHPFSHLKRSKLERQEWIKECLKEEKYLKLIHQSCAIPLPVVLSYLKDNKRIITYKDFIYALGALFQVNKNNVMELRNLSFHQMFTYREEVSFSLPSYIDEKVRFHCLEEAWRGHGLTTELENQLFNQKIKKKDLTIFKNKLQHVCYLPSLGFLLEVATFVLNYIQLNHLSNY